MQPHRHLGRCCADTYDVCGAGATRGENISLVLEDGREKHRSRSVMREMRILLTTSDLFFLYHPPTPSRSLAVRRPTHVRGVGLGFASREPQAVPTELDPESSRHNGISLGIIRQVPRNYLSVSWRAARDAPIPATPAHARTRRTHTRDRARAHACRCSPTLLALLYICIIPSPRRGTRATRSSLVVKGSDRPPLPLGPRVVKGSDRPWS